MDTAVVLSAFVNAVQIDVGRRGLARQPQENLFTATKNDFFAAWRSLAYHSAPRLLIVTGFFIPSAQPPAFETDGPLGALFLAQVGRALGIDCAIASEPQMLAALRVGQQKIQAQLKLVELPTQSDRSTYAAVCRAWELTPTHLIFLERPGPNTTGQCLTMRGRDVTPWLRPAHRIVESLADGSVPERPVTIGIGDGGNEIGMGKLPSGLVAANIPLGEMIHCRTATDYLLVAGVSNWGAYALGAGLFVILEQRPPPELFDVQREKELLEAMVQAGPLVDGVTGRPEATVDGLTWEEYVQPLETFKEAFERWRR